MKIYEVTYTLNGNGFKYTVCYPAMDIETAIIMCKHDNMPESISIVKVEEIQQRKGEN